MAAGLLRSVFLVLNLGVLVAFVVQKEAKSQRGFVVQLLFARHR